MGSIALAKPVLKCDLYFYSMRDLLSIFFVSNTVLKLADRHIKNLLSQSSCCHEGNKNVSKILPCNMINAVIEVSTRVIWAGGLPRGQHLSEILKNN